MHPKEKKLEARNERSARLEAVGQLTGGIAHDFDDLLQLIVGAAEDLQDDYDDRESRIANAGLILSTSLKAAELVRQLMTFARKQPLQARLVNVRTIIEPLDQLIERASEDYATVAPGGRSLGLARPGPVGERPYQPRAQCQGCARRRWW
ncbi:MAG: hypothetical protein U5O39_15210 [Gammaproteobacteria bacterium]|nr:hypothetical protein [Gammaproteobacteria bacterium]